MTLLTHTQKKKKRLGLEPMTPVIQSSVTGYIMCILNGLFKGFGSKVPNFKLI